jgi:hypothetical protein
MFSLFTQIHANRSSALSPSGNPLNLVMAEIIGVVSGAMTFATVVIQIGKSITTIKDFWEELQDAPDDLQKLVEEVKVFSFILADIEEDLSQPSISFALKSSKHALHSFELCKRAAEDLDFVCRELNQDVGPLSNRMRRSRKALKIVMSKGKTKKHRMRLQNVLQLLMLSQQCYTRYVSSAGLCLKSSS